jgi:hypothetical protein
MAGMTDQTFVNALLTNLFKTSTNTVITGGTGGTTQTVTVPFHLRLYSVIGSETASGTELTTSNGYTALGSSLGSVFAGAVSAGAFSNANAVSWSATGSWSTVVAIEIWDTAGTPVRYLWGALTANITGVANGDTIQFAASSISVSAATW